MFKITGIKNGAVLQRDDNGFCSVTLIADFCGKPKSSLGELTSGTDVPVPYGFATTAHGYRHFMEVNGLNEKVNALLATLKDPED